MNRRLLLLPLLGLLLTGCSMRAFNRALGGSRPAGSLLPPTAPAEIIPTEAATHTPAPTATVTPTPTPDLRLIGLPGDSSKMTAYDFAANLCNAEWFAGTQSVPCNGEDPATTSGYVGQMSGSDQGIPANINVLVMYPPQGGNDLLYGKYPAFTVKKGDRFRAVLACRAHNFCDVEFGLDYYDANGRTGLKHWSYLFTDPTVIVDYPLDSIAGLTVQFSLSVRRHGEGQQAYAVWLAPHIYRP